MSSFFLIFRPKRRNLATWKNGIIMDTFKGQGNDEMKRLSTKNNCELVIVSHNLTNKFHPLDISLNQAAKAFISNKFNTWYADRVSRQLSNVHGKMYLKLSNLNPLYVKWIVDKYNHLRKQNDFISKIFYAAGLLRQLNLKMISSQEKKILLSTTDCNLCNCFYFGSLF